MGIFNHINSIIWTFKINGPYNVDKTSMNVLGLLSIKICICNNMNSPSKLTESLTIQMKF